MKREMKLGNPLGQLLSKKVECSKCWQECGEIGTLVHLGGMAWFLIFY